MNKLYIVAWGEDEFSEINIEIFRTPEKCVSYISEIIPNGYYRKADYWEDPLEYLQGYYDWIREKNDNMSEIDINLKIEEI